MSRELAALIDAAWGVVILVVFLAGIAFGVAGLLYVQTYGWMRFWRTPHRAKP